MTRPTSVSASRTAADGSSTKRAWTARHSSLKRRRSSAARGLISSFDTRFWRSVSSSSALRVSPFSATVRSYSGPNFSWSFALRCRIEYHHTATIRIAMITTATMISVASGMLDFLLRLPAGEPNRGSRPPPPPQGMACSREASHSRGRPGARPLGTAGGTSSGWGELQGPLFARDDDRVVLVLLFDRAGRGARRCADRASDDCADGPADDRADHGASDAAGDRAPGLLVTVRGARHVVFPERFASLDAVVRDVALDDSALSHGWISCRGSRRSTPLAHPSVLSERDEVMTVRHLAGGHDALRLSAPVAEGRWGRRSAARLSARSRPAFPARVREGGDEAVAQARDRGDEARPAVVVLELDAQAPDVAVHDVALGHEVGAPDRVEDVFPGHAS